MIVQGDALSVLKKMPSGSVDLVVTDPPYGYSFMGKDWDKAVPSVEIWKETLRVMKAGAFAFVMSAPRQDVLSQMIVRMTDAGFDMGYSSIYWTYSSGFPKAHNIGKAVDKMKGAYGGFQPKPAVEVIIVAMKPITEKTFTAQALKNGKGITWLDDCRIPYAGESDMSVGHGGEAQKHSIQVKENNKGRFPANLLVSDDVLNDGKVYKDGGIGGRGKHTRGEADIEPPKGKGSYSRYFDLDSWENQFPFLIVPKASKKEKNAGCDTLPEKEIKGRDEGQDAMNVPHKLRPAKMKNDHPTVKPLKLMSYLITLGSREGDIVLDPFAGSGTTLLAAKNLKRRYIGCELSPEYVEIIKARLA